MVYETIEKLSSYIEYRIGIPVCFGKKEGSMQKYILLGPSRRGGVKTQNDKTVLLNLPLKISMYVKAGNEKEALSSFATLLGMLCSFEPHAGHTSEGEIFTSYENGEFSVSVLYTLSFVIVDSEGRG